MAECSEDLINFNGYRKKLLLENHEETLRIMTEEHEWKRQRHELKMQIMRNTLNSQAYSVNPCQPGNVLYPYHTHTL